MFEVRKDGDRDWVVLKNGAVAGWVHLANKADTMGRRYQAMRVDGELTRCASINDAIYCLTAGVAHAC